MIRQIEGQIYPLNGLLGALPGNHSILLGQIESPQISQLMLELSSQVSSLSDLFGYKAIEITNSATPQQTIAILSAILNLIKGSLNAPAESRSTAILPSIVDINLFLESLNRSFIKLSALLETISQHGTPVKQVVVAEPV